MPRNEYKFICMDKECIKDGQTPCVMIIFSETRPDMPSYCPYDTEPDQYKFKKWCELHE